MTYVYFLAVSLSLLWWLVIITAHSESEKENVERECVVININ